MPISTTDRYARLAAGYQTPEAEMAEECRRQSWENQGPAFIEGKPPKDGGQPPISGLNESYWITRFADVSGLIFDPTADSFYWFDTGLWNRKTRAEIREELAAFIRETVRQEQERYANERAEQKESEEEEDAPAWVRVGLPTLAKLLSQRGLTPIMERLTGHGPCVRRDAFAERPHGIVLAQNGRLEISRSGEINFDPEDMGRREDLQTTRLQMAYDPEAKSEKLEGWLSRIFCDRADDVSAISKMLGAALWGSSRWKKVVAVYGKANLGKSQIALICERLAGRDRVAEFETRRLGERFEKRRFVSKVVLRAEDVDADFMSRPYSAEIKALTGFGAMRVEGKNTDDSFELKGDKLVVMTSNFELKVLAGADRSAWEERLVYLFADGQSYEGSEQDSYFLDSLFREEGSGVLNFALGGLVELLQKGQWERSEGQMARVKNIMENSDSVRRWVGERVEVTENSDGVTSGEAWADYWEFCKASKVEPWNQREFEKQAYDSVEAATGKTRSHDIKRGETIRRGWHGIRLGAGKRHLP